MKVKVYECSVDGDRVHVGDDTIDGILAVNLEGVSDEGEIARICDEFSLVRTALDRGENAVVAGFTGVYFEYVPFEPTPSMKP